MIEMFNNSFAFNKFVIIFWKYNINSNIFTSSTDNPIDCKEFECRIVEGVIEWIKEGFGDEVKSFTSHILNNSKPDMIGLHYNKMNFINSLLLCCWLRLNLTNKNTGSICSGMEIQKCSEQIRYFTHTPFLLVELS